MRGADVSELTQGNTQHVVSKESGLWLKHIHPGPKTVMTASIVIRYYSKGIMMALPHADSSLALKYIHKKSPDFIALEGRTLNLRPYIKEWIEKGIPEPEVQLIYTKGSSIEEKVVIYRFSGIAGSNRSICECKKTFAWFIFRR